MEKTNKNFGGITMTTLEKIVYNTVVGYHVAMIDINRCLFITGLRSDEKSEAVAEHHCMALLNFVCKAKGTTLEEQLDQMSKRG